MNERKKGKTTKTWNIVKTNSKTDTLKYNLIITAININGLNTEIVKLDKNRPNYMLSTRDRHLRSKTQRGWKWKDRNDIPCKQ